MKPSNFGYRQQISFLFDLSSVPKTHSFGRAGLICLVECIASAASGVLKPGNHDRGAMTDANHAIIGESRPNLCQIDGGHLLDVWRFILECSKQHFNARYRRQGTKLVLSCSVTCE